MSEVPQARKRAYTGKTDRQLMVTRQFLAVSDRRIQAEAFHAVFAERLCMHIIAHKRQDQYPDAYRFVAAIALKYVCLRLALQ
ncbi:MAG: hypothetical protein JOZ51_00815 [Chloroflexi bacterium]|nr:hypothetical protein [Chloroflexota bacterium]